VKVVYIAGPFRATNPDGTQDAWALQNNIMRAMSLALEVWRTGAVALCPHGNTFCFQNAANTPDDVWLNGDLELLRRSDAVLFTPDWQRSSGARAERDFAAGLGLPLFYDVDALRAWLKVAA